MGCRNLPFYEADGRRIEISAGTHFEPILRTSRLETEALGVGSAPPQLPTPNRLLADGNELGNVRFAMVDERKTMFENLANLTKMMRGAGQVMPRIQAMKDKMARTEVEAVSTCGRVSVKLSGTGTLTRLEVCETLLQTVEKQTLETQVAATVNQAIQKAKQLHLEAVQEVVGDLGIPGIDRILAQLAE